MMRLLSVSVALGVVLYLALGCMSDPLGATTREQIRATTALQIAQTQASAQVQTTAAWVGVLPVLVLIIVLGSLAGIVLYFRGKAHLAERSSSSPPPLLEPTDYDGAIRRYAALTGKRVILHQGEYYLLDQATGKTVLARPKLPALPD